MAKLKKKIKTYGLFIDIENPYLNVFPDRSIDKDYLNRKNYMSFIS